MQKRISVQVKEAMVELVGACFWYWNSFYSFLDSAGVPRALYKRYPKDVFNKYTAMRGILSDLEQAGQIETINSLVAQLYQLRGAIDKADLDQARAKSLLADFRELIGDDPVESAIQERKAREARDSYRESIQQKESDRSRLAKLNAFFRDLATGEDCTPQQRGFALERLFFDLVHLSELEHKKPYRTPDGEQIDGHFRYEKFDYLVEVKWISGPTKQEHLAVFDGKIRGKAQSTRGLFLAAEGFAERAVRKFSGDSPRILLMTGEDLALILSGAISFYDLVRAKVDAMVRYGRIDLPGREII